MRLVRAAPACLAVAFLCLPTLVRAEPTADITAVLDPGETEATAVPSFGSYATTAGSDTQDLDLLAIQAGDTNYGTCALSGALVAALKAPGLGKTLAQAPRPTSPQATAVVLLAGALIASSAEDTPQLDPGTEPERADRRKAQAWEFELERLREPDPAQESQSDIWQRPLDADGPLLYDPSNYGDGLAQSDSTIDRFNRFDPKTQRQQWEEWEREHGTLGSVGIPAGTAVMSSGADDGPPDGSDTTPGGKSAGELGDHELEYLVGRDRLGRIGRWLGVPKHLATARVRIADWAKLVAVLDEVYEREDHWGVRQVVESNAHLSAELTGPMRAHYLVEVLSELDRLERDQLGAPVEVSLYPYEDAEVTLFRYGTLSVDEAIELYLAVGGTEAELKVSGASARIEFAKEAAKLWQAGYGQEPAVYDRVLFERARKLAPSMALSMIEGNLSRPPTENELSRELALLTEDELRRLGLLTEEDALAEAKMGDFPSSRAYAEAVFDAWRRGEIRLERLLLRLNSAHWYDLERGLASLRGEYVVRPERIGREVPDALRQLRSRRAELVGKFGAALGIFPQPRVIHVDFAPSGEISSDAVAAELGRPYMTEELTTVYRAEIDRGSAGLREVLRGLPVDQVTRVRYESARILEQKEHEVAWAGLAGGETLATAVAVRNHWRRIHQEASDAL